MRKRLRKKKIGQIADKLADWYVNEFLPSIGIGKAILNKKK